MAGRPDGRHQGSEFATCRERKKNGEPTAKAILYAQNKARERAGGTVLSGYQNAAMRLGNEYELPMVQAYERSQGVLVDRIGFVYTTDRRFGGSPDGLGFSFATNRVLCSLLSR